MGDFLKSHPIFEKLGFDESNQWILYTPGMQDFFIWMANNITEDNIVSDEELRLEQELRASGEWYEGEELEKKLAELEKKFPGILTLSEKDVARKKEELKLLEEMEEEYRELDAKVNNTDADLNKEINDLEMELHQEEKELDEVLKLTMEDAKQLDELKKANAAKITELRKCYFEPQSPPLFMHQMPFDEYFSKLDLFQQHLDMYINANFKIRTSPEADDNDENDQLIEELRDLERQLCTAEFNLVELEARNLGFQQILDEFDAGKFENMTLSQMKNEIAVLDEGNKHLETQIEALSSELKSLIKESAQEKIEEILMENTKIKLERASDRLESLKKLESMSQDALDNAEILWILMQLDMQMIKTFCDNPPTVSNDSAGCARRIEIMLQQTSSPPAGEEAFVNRIADLLTSHLQIQRPTTLKQCLHEYDKFLRMSNNTLKAIVEKKYYKSAEQTMEKLKSLEKIFSKYVFDGPTKAPNFEDMEFAERIHEATRKKEEIEKEVRSIRCDIQTNYIDKMKNDRFWRYRQLLWIWFLTEPKKVVQAIEEVKKAASKVPSSKMLAGIKRKENES